MAGEILSLSDCKAVVKNHLNHNDFEITNVKIKQFFDEVNGFLGEHLLLSIDVVVQQQNQHLRFFMKRFPFEHVLQSDFLKSMNGWQREIYFFETFLHNLKDAFPQYRLDFVPQYLLGKPDDIIVFEDLTLKNYDMPRKPSLNLLDQDHICLVLAALAKFHAGSLAFEEYKSKELGTDFRMFSGEEDLVKEPLIRKQEGFLGYDFYKAAIKGLRALIDKVHRPNEVTLKEVQEKFDVLVENALQLMFPQQTFRNVLAHGDLWAKNVMYQYKGECTKPIRALLVDFQLQRYHVPAHDVLLFISLTTDKEARKNHFHFYLKYYHNILAEELRKLGVNAGQIGVSYEDFLRSVSFIMPEIKIQGPLQRLQQCGNKAFYTNLLNDKENFKKFIFGDKAPFALELFETDSNFRCLLTEAVQEIIEAALYPEVFREDCYRILEEELGCKEYDLETFRVVKSNEGERLFELELVVTVKSGQIRSLRYLVKSESNDFARVVRKL